MAPFWHQKWSQNGAKRLQKCYLKSHRFLHRFFDHFRLRFGRQNGPKCTPKVRPVDRFYAPARHLSSDLLRISVWARFWHAFGLPGARFGSLLAPFGLPLAPLGPPLARFWHPFGSLGLPVGPLSATPGFPCGFLSAASCVCSGFFRAFAGSEVEDRTSKVGGRPGGRCRRRKSTTLLGDTWAPRVTNVAWGFLGPGNPQHRFERFGLPRAPPNPQGPEQTRTKRTTNARVRNGICLSAFNQTPASRNERPASKGGAAVLPPWGLQ